MADDTVSARVEEAVGAVVDAALADLDAAQEEPYYDEAADRSASERYYEGLEAADGEPMREALAELLERTHDPRPAYRPMPSGGRGQAVSASRCRRGTRSRSRRGG